MKLIRQGATAFCLFLALFLSHGCMEARAGLIADNHTPYERSSGYYDLEVHWKGQVFAKYRISSTLGANRGLADDSLWIPSTMTLLSGTDCLEMTAVPNTRYDNCPGFPVTVRQYVIDFNFRFTYEFLGYSFDRTDMVDAWQSGGWKTGPDTFYFWTDTNDNGMTNYTPGNVFHHATYAVRIEPNSYHLWFDKNSPNAVDDASGPFGSSVVAKYDTAWGALPGASKPGYVFLGWYDQPSGGTPITSNTLCVGRDIVEAPGDTAYAHWRPITYVIQFSPNPEHAPGAVSGGMDAVRVSYDELKALPPNGYQKTTWVPAEDEGGDDLAKPSVFKGWSADPEAITPSHANEARIMNLTANDGDVLTFYAIWDDAPKFKVVSYPDRYFTLEEAKSGMITESELLRTVEVYDRETNPLPLRPDGGSGAGVTVVGYDPEEFTGLTDDGNVSIRYRIEDGSGNTGYLNVNVYVSRNGKFGEQDVSYYRSISGPYMDGLASGSRWRDGTYAASLSRALSGGNKAYDLRLSKSQLEKVRAYVAGHGMGNSESGAALREFWDGIR